MKQKVPAWFLALVFLRPVLLFAAPRTERADENTWFTYDDQGELKIVAKDTNKDGKPDSFTTFLKGRNLVLRESDRNFDGKIDRRWLTQWNAGRRLPLGLINNRLEYVTVPGYTTLWSEEDNDFDGKIDAVTERGNQNASKERIGKPIDTPRP